MRNSLLPILMVLLFASCKKMLQIPESEKLISADKVFLTSQNADKAILGIYNSSRALIDAYSSITIIGGLAADELKLYLYNERRSEFELNNVTSQNSLLPWNLLYKIIYQSNDAIERLDNSTQIDTIHKNYLKGEALFMRAYAYHLLVNFFGDVPLLLTTDVQKNSSASRVFADLVYNQVVVDLKESIDLMQSDWHGVNNKARINRWSASALLSRVFLYRRQWENAEHLASSIIRDGGFKLEENIEDCFFVNNKELLFYFETEEYSNVFEASVFVFRNNPSILLTDNFLESFEENDLRKEIWVSSASYLNKLWYYPFKYTLNQRNGIEKYILFRLSEQYVIRAEAQAHLNKVAEAVDDINQIRGRVNLPLIEDHISKDSCLQLIYKERRHELFAETPHRWFDLKRTNQASAVLGKLKPATWQDTDTLFPIPYNDIIRNPNLIQNP